MAAVRLDRRRGLRALAAEQSGHFTAAQAKDLGFTHQAQKYHVDVGNWSRVARGVFRLAQWPVGEHDDLVRLWLWSGGLAVVSHESALALHDLGDVNPATTTLTVPRASRRHPPVGVRLHRDELPTEDVQQFEGFQATTPLRSILDVASDHSAQRIEGVAVLDALDRGLLTVGQLRRRLEEVDPAAARRVQSALERGRSP